MIPNHHLNPMFAAAAEAVEEAIEGYRSCIHLAYHDLPFAVYNTKAEYITRLNQLGGSDDAPIDQDSAALDTLSGKFPSQVEARGPQPFINTH